MTLPPQTEQTLQTQSYWVFYDNRCQLCQKTKQVLEQSLKLDPQVVKLLPLSSLESLTEEHPALANLPKYAYQAEMKAYCLATQTIASGIDAVAICLQACQSPFNQLGELLKTRWLRPIVRPLYQWVANNRYKLFGAFEA
jgi:predicted DCC family thiol-disulfide oxidoreductase YuxK